MKTWWKWKTQRLLLYVCPMTNSLCGSYMQQKLSNLLVFLFCPCFHSRVAFLCGFGSNLVPLRFVGINPTSKSFVGKFFTCRIGKFPQSKRIGVVPKCFLFMHIKRSVFLSWLSQYSPLAHIWRSSFPSGKIPSPDALKNAFLWLTRGQPWDNTIIEQFGTLCKPIATATIRD